MPYPPSSALIQTTSLAPTLGAVPRLVLVIEKKHGNGTMLERMDQVTCCERQDTVTIAYVYDDRPGSL